MKRIFIGTSVAALTMLSACENVQIPEPETPQDQVVFTANLDADTKTYLEWDGEVYKTRWNKDDYIYVFDPKTGNSERCSIVEGVGTSQAKFVGTLEADEYVAVYGNEAYSYEEDQYMIWLSEWQNSEFLYFWNDETQTEEYESRWSNGMFPMVAKSNDKSLEFQNLCSVLKLSLTGRSGDYLREIYLKSNDESVPMYGNAYIDMTQETPVLSFDENWYWGTSLRVEGGWMPLSSDPQELYVVLPAQTYTGGFTITAETGSGSHEFVISEDIEMRRSRIRNLSLPLGSDVWGIYCSGDYRELTEEGNYWVYKNLYIEEGREFKFFANGNWDMSLGYIGGSGLNINDATQLARDGEYLYIHEAGYYDIYLDVENKLLYCMTQGLTPEDVGKDAVWCMETYYNGEYSINTDYTEKDGMLVFEDVRFESGSYFRFYEKVQKVYYGCCGSDVYRSGDNKTNTRIMLTSDNPRNFYFNYAGYYDIYFDVESACVYIMNDGVGLDDIPTTDYVYYDYYQKLYDNVQPGEWVKVYGTVVAQMTEGFILSIDGYYYNNIYVHDPENLLGVKRGYWFDLYAKLEYYNGLPRLVISSEEYWCHIFSDVVYVYTGEGFVQVRDLSSYSSDAYELIRFTGYYEDGYVFDKENPSYRVKIAQQDIIDMDKYEGKVVCLEGYYLGTVTDESYTDINVALKQIMTVDTEGSTGDVVPGDDIIVTKAGDMNGKYINR